ncbi:hypothetical protein F3J45_01785 [Pantoea sp. Ap-967]|uniref:hypothetical protein n=1 Tax=Pantoea sp. Ap-967 TaxID=2608362 RepID=UPI00141D7F26|nr:hypothetical protein [Pantoea sp. Ap-967]NIE73197.1 hypothetical protein [Pantoea sp. Ap-967]
MTIMTLWIVGAGVVALVLLAFKMNLVRLEHTNGNKRPGYWLALSIPIGLGILFVIEKLSS